MNLIQLEKKLKERTQFPYKWGTRQTNALDNKTKEVYNLFGVNSVLDYFSKEPDDTINYALNRWYNFHSAQGLEQIFSNHQRVIKEKNRYHKFIDFYIDDIPFDHKSTQLPKHYQNDINKAINNKKELIEWLYKNQSQQRRFHLKNRLFVVVFDFKQFEHWKVKSEILFMQQQINHYLNNFDQNNLIQLNINNEIVLSDVIFIIKPY